MSDIIPVIVCIAKLESNYIEEFVKYHIALGFSKIFIYDNEDTPVYEKLLEKYSDFIFVIHFPGYIKQYPAYYHFINNYLYNSNITHVSFIDIDEFIVLKQHTNITDFIKTFIKDDCQGIAMNWRFFGSSGLTEPSNIPNTIRFTKCQMTGNKHIKTIFKKDHLKALNTCHDIILDQGYVKTTAGDIVIGPFNYNIDFNYVQINHYKCKTLKEYRFIRSRGRSDNDTIDVNYNPDIDFIQYDLNETTDLTAYNFYKNIEN
jgi:hypothetical protein